MPKIKCDTNFLGNVLIVVLSILFSEIFSLLGLCEQQSIHVKLMQKLYSITSRRYALYFFFRDKRTTVNYITVDTSRILWLAIKLTCIQWIHTTSISSCCFVCNFKKIAKCLFLTGKGIWESDLSCHIRATTYCILNVQQIKHK